MCTHDVKVTYILNVQLPGAQQTSNVKVNFSW